MMRGVLVLGMRGDDVLARRVLSARDGFLLEALALIVGEGLEIVVVVIGMVPDTPRRVLGRVDEELVMLALVELADL